MSAVKKEPSPTFKWPIFLPLARQRDDGGETANYRVFAAREQVTVMNGKGEAVIKNAIYGGNGTIYVAKELSNPHEEFVFMPRAEFDILVSCANAGRPYPSGKETKKGRKK